MLPNLPPDPQSSNPPSPNFSIRNYVFAARSKGINANWPFSPQNLQLCRKHGVEHVLPPFQPLDALRNQLPAKSDAQTTLNIGHPQHTLLESSSNYNSRAIPCESVCQSQIPGNKSTTVSVAPRAVSHKAPRTSGKTKCKLVVRFGSHSDRSSTQDIPLNTTTQPETMASKICPVCKTFSSSSNTTLNAHIDQCLSAESTPKWTVDSKLSSKFRIKPRKTRLMVDVYSTALPCTLEDLDRRNGTNWASASSLPPADPESEVLVKQGVSPADLPTRIDIGDVYIDKNGIKLRILSKSDDAPSIPSAAEHLRPIKGSRQLLSARKKKRRASKFCKYLKLAQNKKLLSSQQICRSEAKNGVAGAISDEGYSRQKQINTCTYGALRQWACSKRTGAAKKLNNNLLHQRDVPKDLRAERNQSHLCQNHKEDELGNSVSAPEKTDGLEKVLYEAQASCVQKGARNSLSERPLTPMKRNARVLRNERSSEDGYHVRQFPKSTAIDDDDDDDPPPAICKKPSRSCHVNRSKDMKVSSAKKDMLSTRTTHIVTNNSGGLRKSREIVGATRSYDLEHRFSVNYHHGREDLNKESSLHRYSGLTQNTRSLAASGRKESTVSESSNSRFRSDYRHDMSSHLLDQSDDVGPGCKDFRCSVGETVSQSSLKTAVKENIASSYDSGNPDQLNRLVPLTKIRSNSLLQKGIPRHVQVISSSGGKSVLGREQAVFYADQLGSSVPVQNVNMGDRDLEPEIALGSFFPVVDPISIPGPPGSFLPIPRDMGSDDFQGNSSLTTSRVQSSQDQPDFIDGDSSDSPVSATSTVSNSTARIYDLKSSESLPYAELQAGRDNIRLGFSGGSIDSSTECATLVSRSASLAAERFNSSDREKSKVNKTTLNDRADTGPCCCQRKERASQDHVFLTQDSQLLKRRMIASYVERQTSCSVNPNMEARDEVLCASSEKAVPYAATSEHVLRGPTDGGGKLLGFGDRDSMSPSSSNSILRLMGKNLMVVNKTQDESMPPGRVQPQPQFITFTSLSPTEAAHSSHQPSVNLGQELRGDARGARIHPASDPRMLYQGAAYSLLDGVELRECYSRPAGRMDQVTTVLDPRHRNLLSPAKEIITMDEASECEADFGNYRGGLVGSHVSSPNIGLPSYTMYESIAEDRSLQRSGGSRQANAGPVRWLSVLQQTSPSSRGHRKSVKQ